MRKNSLFIILILSLIIGTIPLTAFAASGNWSLSYDIKCSDSTSATKKFQLEKVSTNLRNETVNLIVVMYPKNLTLKGVSDSSPWKKEQTSSSGNSEMSTFMSESDQSASAVTSFLTSIYFNAAKVNSKDTIKVAVGKIPEDMIAYPHSDGTLHYYKKVDIAAPKNTWTDSYNAAKESTFLGMKGYLATLTSKSENDYVKNKVGTAPGWLGGTDFLKANGTKIKDDSHIDAPTKYRGAKQFYWACGPEAGSDFFKHEASSATNENDLHDKYSNFNEGQPDNAHYGSKSPEGEGFLEFAYAESEKWNDLNDANDLGGHTVTCYYVEYGGYGEPMPSSGDNYIATKGKSIAYAYEVAHTVKATYDYGKSNITKAELEKMCKMTATDSEGKALDMHLTINIADLEKLNSAITNKKKGTFKVRATTEAGETFSVEVKVVGSTITTTTNKVTITSEVTKEELINKLGVTIVDKDGHPLDPSEITVDEDQLSELNKAIKNRKPGTYKVTLYGPDGTPYVITAVVPDNIAEISGVNGSGSNNSTRTGDDSHMPGTFNILAMAAVVMILSRIRKPAFRKKSREIK